MKKIIWVIDDDFIYQTIIKKLIQKSEVYSESFPFPNGNEAINALKKILEGDNNNNFPDIILLDINMPILDGWEFMDEFQSLKSKINKKINIYIVSSSIAVEDKKKAESYGEIMRYMSKPVSVDVLVELASKE
ncbi:Response regulator receiver domain-containing protein [Flavobacterium fluvii]|uniref:Response regulator receiver domain-containing protein n=1 Tax=Flavobacterium fluvii TaxID=468056 RepID=A0A1M5NFK9_9FLAO|nr:response regulator [Flavobacterium fluvii]SHG88320.1 Response regulator receiver domain-containing protein [Flavobacterium fluvii]